MDGKTALKNLYKHLDKAKYYQTLLVSEYGEELQEDTRKQVVEIWNNLDDCAKPILTAMQNEKLRLNI